MSFEDRAKAAAQNQSDEKRLHREEAKSTALREFKERIDYWASRMEVETRTDPIITMLREDYEAIGDHYDVVGSFTADGLPFRASYATWRGHFEVFLDINDDMVGPANNLAQLGDTITKNQDLVNRYRRKR